MDARPEVVAAPQRVAANPLGKQRTERLFASGLTPTLGFFSNLPEIGAAKPGQILIKLALEVSWRSKML